MNEVKWTASQRKAIYTNDKNLLISAAAGSGKTSVLTEKVIEILKADPTALSKILVVTFTKAAAAQMRAKIVDKLNLLNIPEAQELIACIHTADIGTIHSFCSNVVKENYEELGVPPKMKTLDGDKALALKMLAFDEISAEFYEQMDKDYLRIVETYARYSDENLKSEIISLYDKLERSSGRRNVV